jgi:hypothetical protein
MRRWACYLAAVVICAGCAAPKADPPTSGSTPGAADAEGEAAATPRMPDGKPDLNGVWGGGGGGDD